MHNSGINTSHQAAKSEQSNQRRHSQTVQNTESWHQICLFSLHKYTIILVFVAVMNHYDSSEQPFSLHVGFTTYFFMYSIMYFVMYVRRYNVPAMLFSSQDVSLTSNDPVLPLKLRRKATPSCHSLVGVQEGAALIRQSLSPQTSPRRFTLTGALYQRYRCR